MLSKSGFFTGNAWITFLLGDNYNFILAAQHLQKYKRIVSWPCSLKFSVKYTTAEILLYAAKYDVSFVKNMFFEHVQSFVCVFKHWMCIRMNDCAVSFNRMMSVGHVTSL